MKVSVIIPIYNVEKYINDCISSVINQSLDDIEIICIDDSSTDNSYDIAKQLSTRENRIKLFRNEENLGLAATRNRGISLAKGEFIYFLDSDDMIELDALENLYNHAVSNNLEVEIFGAKFIFETSELEAKFKTNSSSYKQQYDGIFKGKDLFIKWMEIWDWMPSQPRYFYKRKFIIENNIRFIDGMLHEDETFTLEVLYKAKRISVSNDLYFIRRFRENSIMTGNMTMKNVEGCIIILDYAMKLLSENEEDILYKRALEFYIYKITNDVIRKYKIATNKNKEFNWEEMLSSEMRNNKNQMSIYHMISAKALYGED